MAEPQRTEAWRISEIDFCEDAICRFCKKKLRRGIAIFVVDAEGHREPCGPTCAAKYALAPEGRIPDFTQGAREEPSEDEDEEPARQQRSPGRSASPSSSSKASKKEGHRVLEYLRLRVEKLADFEGARTKKLAEIHDRWQQDLHTDEDYRYLSNLIAKMQREQTPWSHENLQACYAYGYWIGRLVASVDEDYPRDVLRFLQERLFLTEKQIAGLNKWFKNRDMPTLDTLTFTRLQRPSPTPPEPGK